jgi:glycosyltransferase involved in cell wall biosynthesis
MCRRSASDTVIDTEREAPLKLSVIIPCFNAADTLGAQLAALAAQEWGQPWEVIIADNNSTDGSVEVARAYQARLPHLRIVDASGRKGQPYALNAGAAAARGESLVFCDADDVVAPGWIAAMGNALATHDFIACRWEVEELNSPRVRGTRKAEQVHGLQQYKYPPYLPHAGGGSLGIKRRLHIEIGGYDESLPTLHDTDYCWRLQRRGVKLHFVPEAVLHVRFRDTISGVYRQAHSYGEYNVALYKRYRQLGMPPSGWRRALEGWWKLVRRLPDLRRPHTRLRWFRHLGWRMGRLRGCVKHRTFAP